MGGDARKKEARRAFACDFYVGAGELGKAARWQAWGLGEEKGKTTQRRQVGRQ